MDPERAAPSVVAVVVACAAGAWFDDTLKSLAGQDYPRFSVLVVDVGEDQGLSARVASVLPDARVARLPAGTGFPQAANQGVAMVEGVAHILLCHDDVMLAPDAVRLLLEEAYRSNAGLTCPKYLLWGPPDRLLSVGMGVDRLGVAYPLVEPGELDQGQHDAVREVFVAPSGAVLVRTDLWRALGGFSGGAADPGEDLDISWRAQLAGARVVVAPQAVVRHLEATSQGLRGKGAGQVDVEGRARRDQNRLRSLWTCYSIVGLVLVAPVVVLFVVAEVLWALAHRRRGREVVGPVVALARSFDNPRQLRADRARAQKLRRTSDFALWKSQSRGSARLRAVVRLRLEKGHQLAWVAGKAAALEPRSKAPAGTPEHLPAGELDTAQPDHREEHAAMGVLTARPKAAGGQNATSGPVGWIWTAGAMAVTLVLLVIGSRGLLTGSLPLVGQLPSGAGGTGSWWHQWWSGAGAGGLAGTAFSAPGLFFMGLLGGLSLGSSGLAVHLLVLGPLALGPLGTYVETQRFGSQRGRLTAMVLYAALPVPFNALAQGHWAGLVSFAAAPWLVGGLCRLGGQAPYPFLHWDGAWPRFVVMGLGLALVASFAPGMFLVAPLVGVAFLAGSLLAGRGQGGARLLLASLIASAVGFLALAPWTFGAMHSWSTLVGSPSGVARPLGLSQVLRLQTGPYGGGPLGWALLIAAALPLLIGRSWRLAWAGRLWLTALACMAAAWVGSRGWFPLPSPELLLAPAGAALAFAVALGAVAVEVDLSGYRFGWRQFAPALGAMAAVAAALPFVYWTGNGQWDQPSSGAESAYPFPPAGSAGDYRVLWVGGPSSLPLAPEGATSGLSFATTLDGLPLVSQLWASAGGAAVTTVGQDLAWADSNQTTALGHLLAPFAVRYIVVPASAADLRGPVGAAGSRMVDTLGRQVDLVPVGFDPGYQVFANSAWMPLFALLGGSAGLAGLSAPAGTPPWEVASGLEQFPPRSLGGVPVGTSDSGTFSLPLSPAARVLYGAVPSGSWGAEAGGRTLAAQAVAVGGTAWTLPAGTAGVSLSRSGSGARHLAGIGMVLIWAIALLAAVSRLPRDLGDGLRIGGLEVGAPGEDVPEIDWSAVLDGQNVG